MNGSTVDGAIPCSTCIHSGGAAPLTFWWDSAYSPSWSSRSPPRRSSWAIGTVVTPRLRRARHPPRPTREWCPSPTTRRCRPGGAGRHAGTAAGRSQSGPPDRTHHRCAHGRPTVAAGRRPADAARVHQQGADRRGRSADARPRRAHHHQGGRRRPDEGPGPGGPCGGGDPTLSAAPPEQDTWYRGAARISDLADQVRRSGVDVTAVQVDTSLFTGPKMAPGWDPADIDGGDIAPIESVMLDGGRTQPDRRIPTVADQRWTRAGRWPPPSAWIPRPSPPPPGRPPARSWPRCSPPR